MSYILDALKKSEAEQDPVAAASLALNRQRADSRYRMTAILATALLANAAVLLWLFGPTELAAPSRTTAAPAVTAPAVTAPAEIESLAAPAATARASTESVVRATFEPASPPAAQIRARLADLPTTVRRRFPGLVFSTHIYAEDPSFRAVVANGKRLVEGDTIEGAAVEQITEDGVILAFENYLVEIPVVAEWN